MRKVLTSKDKKQIISNTIDTVGGINKSYLNNTFIIDFKSAETFPKFEKDFQRTLAQMVNRYIENDKKDDSKSYNRSIVYSLTLQNEKIIINF